MLFCILSKPFVVADMIDSLYNGLNSFLIQFSPVQGRIKVNTHYSCRFTTWKNTQLTPPPLEKMFNSVFLFSVLGVFDRRDSWGSPQHLHDPRAPPRDEPRDPRMMRGPGPPPPEANENKPAIRPLMSLSPPPLPMGQAGFDIGLDDDSWKGNPDRRGRKRSGDQEGFRDGDRDRGPPKAMRPEDEWRRGPGKI